MSSSELLTTFKAPNRVGNIPLHWYDDLPHVGYDVDGKKVLKPARGDELDKFLKTVDDPSAWWCPVLLPDAIIWLIVL